MNKPRLKQKYFEEMRPQLKDQLNLKNIMDVPRLNKIVVNVGVKEAVADNKVLQVVSEGIKKITGQVPVKTRVKKSIAGFKIRAGMPIGVMVTLRGDRMYEFLDRLINLALPNVRDFQGIPSKFDGQGNYNLGIKEWLVFPEIDYTVSEKPFGLNITIHTSAEKDAYGFELLKKFGMPFRGAI